MKKILLPLLFVAPLAAQSFELGLNVSRQSYTTQTAPPGIEPQDKTVVAGRIGYSFLDLGPALFQVTAVYQPKADTEVQSSGAATPWKVGHEYAGVGVMFNFKALVAIGAGVDYRFEKSTYTDTLTTSHTFSRPWARVNAGYAFPTPLVKPFIGIEAAVPLTKEDLAPKFQVGLYGGVRF